MTEKSISEVVRRFTEKEVRTGKARRSWQVFSSSSFQPSRSWMGIDWLGASGFSRGGRKLRQVSRDDCSQAVWSVLAAEMCRFGGMLAAVLTQVMFEAHLRPEEKLSLELSSFLSPTEGGVRSWVILLFTETGTARTKTEKADDTIRLDSKLCGRNPCSIGFSAGSRRTSRCSA